MKSKISESTSFSPLSGRQNQLSLHRKRLFSLILTPRVDEGASYQEKTGFCPTLHIAFR